MRKVNDMPIQSEVSSNKAKNIFQEQLLSEGTRKHILSIVGDYVDSVPFMEKVKKYAGQELDRRMFISSKFWITTASAAAVSALITVFISNLLAKP